MKCRKQLLALALCAAMVLTLYACSGGWNAKRVLQMVSHGDRVRTGDVDAGQRELVMKLDEMTESIGCDDFATAYENNTYVQIINVDCLSEAPQESGQGIIDAIAGISETVYSEHGLKNMMFITDLENMVVVSAFQNGEDVSRQFR